MTAPARPRWHVHRWTRWQVELGPAWWERWRTRQCRRCGLRQGRLDP